jgi:tetratricopeptide (TPR) repeat protein
MKSLVFLAVLAAATPAFAQTPNPQAEALNEEGKKLYAEQKDYAGAAAKFQGAIALSPDARYYFNLCMSLDKQEKFDDALIACDEVYNRNPDAELQGKAGKRASQIRAKIRARQPVDPANPNPTPTPPVVEEPEPEPIDPGRNYKYSLGGQIGLWFPGGLGDDTYNGVGTAFKVDASLMLSQKLGLGLQLFAGASLVSGSREMSVWDAGAALYWTKKIAGPLYFSPLGGVSLVALFPEGPNGANQYASFGFHLEPALEIVVGGGTHSFRIVPLGIHYYLPPASNLKGDTSPQVFGLEDGGLTIGLSIGYGYRFTKDIMPGDIFGLE